MNRVLILVTALLSIITTVTAGFNHDPVVAGVDPATFCHDWKTTCQGYCLSNQYWNVQRNQCYPDSTQAIGVFTNCICNDKVLTDVILKQLGIVSYSPPAPKPSPTPTPTPTKPATPTTTPTSIPVKPRCSVRNVTVVSSDNQSVKITVIVKAPKTRKVGNWTVSTRIKPDTRVSSIRNVMLRSRYVNATSPKGYKELTFMGLSTLGTTIEANKQFAFQFNLTSSSWKKMKPFSVYCAFSKSN